MKKISYYLILLVAIGGAMASFWIYQKYFKVDEPKLLLFKVEKGSIQELVKVRGGVVAQKDFDLEFPFSGIVEKVFAQEGRQVNQGDSLMKLETVDFDLEVRQLEAVLAQRQANLNKLLAGATPEDINVFKIKVENAKTALADAKQNLLDKLQDAHTKSDDSIRNKTDQYFVNLRSSSPKIVFAVYDDSLKVSLESSRLSIETTLTDWKISLQDLTVLNDLNIYTNKAKQNLYEIKNFLTNATLALNDLTSGTTITQTTIDTYRSDTSTARTNINTAIVNLTAADEKLKTAESNLALAQNELALKEAKTRNEDIEIAKAQIEEIKSKIAAFEEKIKKSVIYAPGAAKVTKVWFEVGEVFRPGQTAVSLSTSGHKIQADVSELEIGKVRGVDGNEVSIRLDAFPGQELKGKIISIEPKEIIKEGDKYYRVNIYMEPHGLEIRSGMNADLIIHISSKENVLKIPEFSAYAKGDKKFVKILDGNIQREIEVKIGISDGESIEVISGLQEGQTIAVSVD